MDQEKPQTEWLATAGMQRDVKSVFKSSRSEESEQKAPPYYNIAKNLYLNLAGKNSITNKRRIKKENNEHFEHNNIPKLRHLLRLFKQYAAQYVKRTYYSLYIDDKNVANNNYIRSVNNITEDSEDICLRHDNYDCIVVCSNYPGLGSYGGEFIRSRVRAYANLTVLVLEVNRQNTAAQLDDVDGVECLRIEPRRFLAQIADLNARTTLILSHAPKPFVLNALISSCEPSKLLFWFHGAEVRDYRRLYFNYSTEEIEEKRKRHDAANRKHWESTSKCFLEGSIKKLFVSDYIKSVAEEDIGCKAKNSHVIHNFIDGDFYVDTQKSEKLLKKFLLIRSFQFSNYANDIAIKAIQILSERDGFDELQFTICGFGPQFGVLTRAIAPLKNVTIDEGYKDPEEMRQLHSQHGVFLCPTRFDTQGVTMGEAMASGLVCITNRVAAIPEFTDHSCAILVRPNDPPSYAEAIWRAAHDPTWAQSISRAAAARVRAQCSYEQTIARELSLLRTAMANRQSVR